jgi:hypothetical protein
LRPYLLGTLFDLVVNGLRNLPHVKPDGGPRMMDTYLWLLACEEGTGLKLAENYRRHVDEVLGALAVEDLLVQTLLDFLKEHDEKFEGKASDLYKELVLRWPVETAKEERQCPGNPSVLGSRLRQLEEPLSKIGVRVKFQRNMHHRIISIDATGKVQDGGVIKGPNGTINEATAVNNQSNGQIDEVEFVSFFPEDGFLTFDQLCERHSDFRTRHQLSRKQLFDLGSRLAQEGKLSAFVPGCWRRGGRA